MERPDRVPAGIDVDQPNAARMYDYFLDGLHNFAADRQLARQTIALVPDIPLIAQTNRAFMRRAVRMCSEAGIRQFLDIGSGIPTLGNVHEIAQRLVPDTSVVYVDLDSVAVAYSREIFLGNERTAVIQEDLRRPEAIVNHPDLHRVLDLASPVALLLVAILHFIDDSEDLARILTRLGHTLVPGSFLVISHWCDASRPQEWEEVKALVAPRLPVGVTSRTLDQVEAFFAGFELIPPGVVWAPQWRPDHRLSDERPERSSILAGVGRKT